MDWRQIQFALCVVAMVMIHLSGDNVLFLIAAAAAIVNFISSRLLCIFGQTCTLDSGDSSKSPAFFLVQVNRITGMIGVGLLIYAVLNLI
jgi:hypothetical protein